MMADALPNAQRSSLHAAMKSYLHFIVAEDWPAMAEGHVTLRRIPPGLTDALTALLTFVPSGPGEQLAQQHAVQEVEQALEARRSRILLSQAVIAPVQWIVILVLTALILVTIAMVHIDRRATVAVNLFIFSTAVAACLVLLMVNDRPFSAGGYTVQPAALRQLGVIETAAPTTGPSAR